MVVREDQQPQNILAEGDHHLSCPSKGGDYGQGGKRF